MASDLRAAFLSFSSYAEAHRWSREQPAEFARWLCETIGVSFLLTPSQWYDAGSHPSQARWLTGGLYNIADTCLQGADESPAILTKRSDGAVEVWSYARMKGEVARVEAGLRQAGHTGGDAIAIYMPMGPEAVAAYLAIIRLGCVVVSIADSLPATEVARRLRIAGAKRIFTQDYVPRAGKLHPLYARVVEAGQVPATVRKHPGLHPAEPTPLRQDDTYWQDFIPASATPEPAVAQPAQAFINILFSSGTTGDPKAIPWNQTTPLKCAADAYFHQGIRPGDAVAWPTNLGWMMGPWLIFATLLHRGTIVLYEGSPVERGFCEWVAEAKVNVLGLVPAIVRGWRKANLTDGCDWSPLRCFSSTGEASQPEDYAWLQTAGQPVGVRKPIIEYCGGTEVGGGYITNSIGDDCPPSQFSAKAIGSDFVLLNEDGKECQPGEVGEVFLIPPALGLSHTILNRDHDAEYYAGCPTWNGIPLRRHGDRMRRLPGGRYVSDGRADDTFNLGGIKTSSAEIEAALVGVPGITELAAVGVPPPGGGPDRLILFVVGTVERETRAALQKTLASRLNPLFSIHAVVPVDQLPRTASNKLMRRELRKNWQAEEPSEAVRKE